MRTPLVCSYRRPGTGESSIHNLKSPHILLRDLAISKPLGSAVDTDQGRFDYRSNNPSSSETTFYSFIKNTLSGSRDSASSALQSTTAAEVQKRHNEVDLQNSATGSIPSANLHTPQKVTRVSIATRFEIQRGGNPFATIILNRASYKPGDTIIGTIDLQSVALPCYCIYAYLESFEEVDDSLALRSKASILRATRRTQASQLESTVCARRLSFKFLVPVGATPEFRTSHVQLKWVLRFEFATQARMDGDEERESLEEVATDERGCITAAAQELSSEAFEVLVPVNIRSDLIGSATDRIPSIFVV